jgi:hypothetical protein
MNGEPATFAGHNAKLIIRKRGLICCSANMMPFAMSKTNITFGMALWRRGRMLYIGAFMDYSGFW